MFGDKLVIPILTSEKKIELILYGESTGDSIVIKDDAILKTVKRQFR